MPVPVNAENFETEVLGAGLPVLLDFFGERCMPCRLLRPILIELAEEYAGRLKVCMMNTDREEGESEADYREKLRVILDYGVQNLPTLLLFAEGKPRRTVVGLHTKEELQDILAQEGLRPAAPEDSPAL